LLAFLAAVEVVLVVALWAGDADGSIPVVITVFGTVIGILGGIVIGLLAGRLNDEHLKAPVWLLALLFTYAAIQPLYPVVQGVLKSFVITGEQPLQIASESFGMQVPACSSAWQGFAN
jgi:hypothetical protein